MSKRILFLQAHQLSVFTVLKRDRVVHETKFSLISKTIPAEVTGYISSHIDSTFTLVVDLMEEECHTESMPSIGLRDRKHYFNKLRAKYFSNPLLSCLSVNKNSKKSTVVISGIDQHEVCNALLKILAKSGAMLHAIHSSVTLSWGLCKKLKLSGANLLVLQLDRHCFRLMACVETHVVISRRVEYSEQCSDVQLLESLENSIQETLVYLERQSIAGWEKPVINLIGKIATEYVSGSDTNTDDDMEGMAESGLPVVAINLKNVTQLVGTPQFASQYADVLIASVSLSTGKNYARSVHRTNYVRKTLHQMFLALVLSLAGGAVATAAVVSKINSEYTVLGEEYSRSTTVAKDSSSLMEADYEYSVEAVRQALVTAQIIEMRSQYSPLVFLTDVSDVLVDTSGVSITSVAWERKDTLDAQSLGELLDQSSDVEVVPMELFYTATVSGHISGSAGSSLDAFDLFVSRLRLSTSDATVVVLDAPYGVSAQATTSMSDKALSSEIENPDITSDESTDNGKFVVELSRRELSVQ